MFNCGLGDQVSRVWLDHQQKLCHQIRGEYKKLAARILSLMWAALLPCIPQSCCRHYIVDSFKKPGSIKSHHFTLSSNSLHSLSIFSIIFLLLLPLMQIFLRHHITLLSPLSHCHRVTTRSRLVTTGAGAGVRVRMSGGPGPDTRASLASSAVWAPGPALAWAEQRWRTNRRRTCGHQH